MRRFREIKEVRNESETRERRKFEERLARLDQPLYEDSERDDESLIRIIGQDEFNRLMLAQMDKRMEELGI